MEAPVKDTRTILVIEDDGDISDAIAMCLGACGYEVWAATNGRDALSQLRSAAVLPDLILLDLMMPVMDGWQFRCEQRADPVLAGVPVVLLSAHMDVKQAAADLGAVSWLKKPVELDELLATVKRSGSALPGQRALT